MKKPKRIRPKTYKKRDPAAKKPVVHGTLSGYQYHRCRCESCRAARSEYRKIEWLRVKARRPSAPSADDLFVRIRRVLAQKRLNPQFLDDIQADIALLIVEGRIDSDNLDAGITRYMPELRRRYRDGDILSLDAPLREDDATSATLGDIVEPSTTLPRRGCPNCRKKVKPGRTYCSNTCALNYSAKQRTKIDPAELEYLHKVRNLPRKQSAKAFGVTVNGINNVVSRKGLARNDTLPEICKIEGCEEPSFRFRNQTGGTAGNLCIQHKRERDRQYTKAWKIRNGWKPESVETRNHRLAEISSAHWQKSEAERNVRQEAKRAEIDARIRARKERACCANGHPWTKASTYVKKSGGKGCRICQRLAVQKYKKIRKGGS